MSHGGGIISQGGGQCEAAAAAAAGSSSRLWDGEICSLPPRAIPHRHLLCRLRVDARSRAACREWWRAGCCCSWRRIDKVLYTLEIPLFVMEHYVPLSGSSPRSLFLSLSILAAKQRRHEGSGDDSLVMLWGIAPTICFPDYRGITAALITVKK